MPSATELRAVFAGRQFRRLYATRLSSQFADGLFQVSLASAVLFNPERQTTAAGAAAGFAVLLLPYSLVGPFAGVFLDRWRRQRVFVVANLVRTLLVLLVAGLTVAVGPVGAGYYAAALSVISVNRFFLSGLSAALPHVVSTDRLVLGNAVSTTSGTLATTAGGGCALVLRAALGADDAGNARVAVAAAAVYAGSALLARRLDADLLGPDLRAARLGAVQALGAVVGGLLDGARHVAARRPALHALLAIGTHRFFYGVSTIATLLLYRNYFVDRGLLRAGLVGLGQVFVASAVGVVVAAVATPPVTRRIGTKRWVVAVFAAASGTEVAFGLPYRQDLLLVAAAVLGFAAQASKICVDTIVQANVDDAFRGRVFSFYDTLFNLTFVSAAAAAALSLPTSGRSYIVLGGIAAGYGALALVYGLAGAGPDEGTGRQPAAQDRSSATARS